MAIEFPETFNLADYYLNRRIDEGMGAKTAVLFGRRAYSYAEVAQRTGALSRYLLDLGLRRDERVYIVLPDSPAFVWSLFATWKAGAVVAMGNPLAPAADLAYVLDYIHARVLITVPAVAEALAPQLNEHRDLDAILLVPDVATGEDPEELLMLTASLREAAESSGILVGTLAAAVAEGESSSHRAPLVQRDDMACWLFTSGSTGRPKAAMHSHRDFAFNTEVYAKATLGYRADDITVSVPRLFFGYATGTNLLFPFAVGATAALFSEPPEPQSLARAIALYRPSIVTNVPTMLGKLLASAPDLDWSSVRFQLSAGEALPPTLLARFMEHHGTDIYDGIGSAEMFHIYCTNRPGDIKPGSLGRVVAGYELKVLPTDAEGPGAAEVTPGDTGVLWVKGDSVALGYYGDRDKSWRTFYGHWCRTGDLFSCDAEGYLWFRGRADDLFKVNGRWMAPQEVEECLLQHPAVAACAVVPIQIDGLTKPKALVVRTAAYAEGDITTELQRHVRDHIARHKYPRVVEYVADLPKNDRGKLDRKALKAGATAT
ncbi:benzoate-CoA ligase family protein [Exilibacterium tricleocarpae]|uniref:Benzoate-CoA ligase family protein n=1 Tax=Exilibacterium tricleocarpae TaxID=2591008 RepID=A0A545SYV5_9GAMM|nr:benzoate-CoA ligase family protein [Exilibacterium tricleocarpae]TQV70156.1 benzoate-CoA ligase family protein [Exilibacterium tricleocarpae]